ncbi:C40 family peptidase [Nonomuraea solani]|nr:C40 family peptidase [Nonomuraea solani]
MNGQRPLLLIALTIAISYVPGGDPPALAGCVTHFCRQTVAKSNRAAGGAIAVRAALEMIGVPYTWGGGGPDGPGFGIGKGAKVKGFDCSGLAEYAWARAGVLIGTTTYEQWRTGIRLPKEEVEPGDLVFYDNDPRRPGPEHVAVAVDATRMVHAPYTGQFVRLDPLDRRTFMGAVRPSERAANTDPPDIDL